MPPFWAPTASLARLRARARHLATIRCFFAERDVLEVETPVLGQGGSTDPYLASLSLEASTPEGRRQLWLQTSPEGHMKRLLAAGSGPIFQLARVFRDGETGRRHNIEFTMLEWYRPGMRFDALIDETCALISRVLGKPLAVTRLRYREVFKAHVGLDPLTASLDVLRLRTEEAAGVAAHDWSRDVCLDLLMSYQVEPALGRGCLSVVQDFPASQAALARCHRDDDGEEVASRFEVYHEGMELANGYDELTDAVQQRQRFDADAEARREAGLPRVAPDERLLLALQAGLPPSCGVAMGVDRLVMLAEQADTLSEIMAFDSHVC
ncbi:EF-P lysine aminoacylase EpmA [Larsenimonas rhizosphaerae]|uniref:EF-P lysine aminoacylase EpmA n=1 Tax=Larsenimonas rhizosphaerae TaxID=2944682 RepID=UPI002033B188|nr:EF-P lysine aminoacylase EpmA [Larsenimonas rhizosphaerae]MCM2132100.1 EF-P lysine aminoacylase EpmA [Larsenimonas rhizosphaerae]